MATIVRGKNSRKPYTVRYWLNGTQKERSFQTSTEANGFKAKVEYEARTHSFVDPKISAVTFAEYPTAVVDSMAIATNTKLGYTSVLKSWIIPWAGNRSRRKVAEDRE